jgi:hypothetical protein
MRFPLAAGPLILSLARSDTFGEAIDVNGDMLAVGAPGHDPGGPWSRVAGARSELAKGLADLAGAR